MGWYTHQELLNLGLRRVGVDVRISTDARLYRPEQIEVGDQSRIDDGALLTPGPDATIVVGRNVHIASDVILEAPAGANLGDFCGIAARTTLYGSSDDYSGQFLTGPTVATSLRGMRSAPIVVGRHAIIGAHCVVLPGARIGMGCSVGAMTLVTRDLDDFGVYAGVPARKIRERSREFLALEDQVDG